MRIRCNKCRREFNSKELRRGRCVHCSGRKFTVISGNIHHSYIGSTIDGDSFLDDLIDFSVAATIVNSIFSSSDEDENCVSFSSTNSDEGIESNGGDED